MGLSQDVIRLIIRYLPVKCRLVCREWSESIPYNFNRLKRYLNNDDTIELLLKECKSNKSLIEIIKVFKGDDRMKLRDGKKFGENGFNERSYFQHFPKRRNFASGRGF